MGQESMLTISITDGANERTDKVDVYGVLNALENTLAAAPFEARKALHDTLTQYAEDCPSEYSLATGPLAPTLLHQLLSVIERDPGVGTGEEPVFGGLTSKFVVADGFVIADGRRGRIVAIRHYDDNHPDTGERLKLRDYLVVWDDKTHSLFIAGDLPGDMPFERTMTLAEVFEWYQDYPEGIECAVVRGA